MKLQINIFVAEDNFKKPCPVTIFAGNIIPDESNALPFIKDDSVNFSSHYSKMYLIRTKNKCNVRFLYPYTRNYIKAGTEGRYEAFAYLTLSQRIILRLINKDTFYHKNKVASITLLVNIIIGIANIIFAIINVNLRGDYSYQKTTTTQTQLLIQQSELLRQQSEAIKALLSDRNLDQADTLKQKEKLK